jgi:hypothetical protein
MAATITVVCPECDKAIEAPAEFVGKKVRCKSCGHVFAARPAPPPGAVARSPSKGAPPAAPKPSARAASAPDDDDDGDDAPYQVTSTDQGHTRCPECANELESDDAIICLHCGYNTRTREKIVTRKIEDTTDGDRVMWLLPGIICAGIVLFLFIFDLVYCLGVQATNDSSWLIIFMASGAVKMWLCIGSVFIMFVAGRFALLRLVFNPTPPEVDRH